MQSEKAVEAGRTIYAFDRYVSGLLMAEGVTIERAKSFQEACATAARIASRGPNGETPILVLRAATPSPDADAVVEVCARVDAVTEQAEHVALGFACSMDVTAATKQLIKLCRALKGTFPADDGWRTMESAPKNTKVLVAYKNRLGNWRIVTACYHTQLAWSDEYGDEEEEFAPEAWYEESDNSEVIYPTEHAPVRWRPLPSLPSAQETNHEAGTEGGA